MIKYNGKKILFICSNFYNYTEIISKELESQGAEVTYYDERASHTFLYKALSRLNLSIFFKRKNNNYYSEIINKRQDYTDILIISPEIISEEILLSMKKNFHSGKFILYMWDSIKNKKNSKKLLKHFDKIYSFDLEDSKENKRIIFEPLFYDKSFENSETTKEKYNLSFIGSIHSDRLDIIKQFDTMEKKFSYLYSPSKIFTYLKLKNINLISHNKIDINDVSVIFKKSKAIIDIHHPRQNGLTMRSFETLAAGKKLITTNKSIINYDFYHENNIYVLDRKKINLNDINSFLNKEFNKEINEKIKHQKIDNWLDRIMN
ncbi:TPA: hypothetical protein LLS85_001956 [Providencia rettgeri]|nr:hypothetical protein [Providencia rettgeri]